MVIFPNFKPVGSMEIGYDFPTGTAADGLVWKQRHRVEIDAAKLGCSVYITAQLAEPYLEGSGPLAMTLRLFLISSLGLPRHFLPFFPACLSLPSDVTRLPRWIAYSTVSAFFPYFPFFFCIVPSHQSNS